MLKDDIIKLVEEKLEGSDCFLVDVKVSPSKIMVFMDRPTGIRIEDCVELSRFLQERLEESNVLEHHELEVSSPGMDEPLKVLQQFQKRIGRQVSVITFDGIKHQGILRNASNLVIELEETTTQKINGKKEKITQTLTLPFTRIKETKVLVSFEKAIK